MKCDKCSHENPEGAKFCSNCGAQLVCETIEERPEEAAWYYVQAGASTGPFTKEEMIRFIESGTLNRSSFVWKTGMDDWKQLYETELAAWLPKIETTYNTGTGGTGCVPASVHERNIVLYIILSIVTCGIFAVYWFYAMAQDVNNLADAQNKPRGVDPLVAVLLLIVTCGIYGIYYFWKEGNVLASLSYPNYKPSNDAAIMAILSIFVEIISLVILQSDLNDIVKYGG